MPDESPSDPDPRIAEGFTPSRDRGSSKPSTTWEPPDPEELQKDIPQYKVLDLVGRGGMGAVYKGWQVSLERYVAIKVLPPSVDDGDAQFAARFKQEAKTMARFMHPGIVGVFDAGETSTGLLYIVMEFVEGTDVAEMVRSQGRLTADHALAITAHVCDALQYAHTRGVIHRDIKPANIMVNNDGQVKVADFGLAKANEAGGHGLTRTNVAMGTPDYIAPECLITGIISDHRADLYAVGVMLYNMLTGETPRGRFKPASEKVRTDPRFDAIVNKAMQSEREDRYQSAQEIRHDLDVILATPMVQAQPAPQPGPQSQAPARKPVARGPQRNAGATASVPADSVPAASKLPPARRAKYVTSWGNAGDSATISGAGHLIGISVAVIFVAGLIIFWAPWSKKKPGPSKTSVPSTVAPEFARFTPSKEAWKKMTFNPNLRNSSTEQGTSLRFAKAARSTISSIKNGAVRMLYSVDDAVISQCSLFARLQEQGKPRIESHYSVKLNSGQIQADLFVTEDKQSRILKSFIVPEPARRPGGQPVELELRVVGTLLFVKINGVEVGRIDDSTIPEGGQFAVSFAAGAVLHAMEELDLSKKAPAPAAATAKSTAPATTGSPALGSIFNGKDFKGWKKLGGEEVPADWRVVDGAMVGGKRSCIVSQQQFRDFELELEWRVSANGNGGIFYHVPPMVQKDAPVGSPELQLAAPGQQSQHAQSGALFRVIQAREDASRPVGEWNRARLVVRGGKAEHWINDRLVCEYDVNAPDWAQIVADSKFNEAFEFPKHPTGAIGLQSWQEEVAYRNVRIRSLKP